MKNKIQDDKLEKIFYLVVNTAEQKPSNGLDEDLAWKHDWILSKIFELVKGDFVKEEFEEKVSKAIIEQSTRQ